ncbi:class I SAM-dependent methyltransferase [Lactococcus formosensis]|uniref:Class I SAM-dependent methyltransferase n=1 Tax=Lactococcus formosensis TaxID=1281486 RepID=A0A9Q8Y085_9LACT|nr:class I SAM-dependent methyltransferase [Lactococcus formosensis]MDG6111012.1 class I SAM-dependent methyltransferase [Lactococcus formosensis]MDG6117380.1 class I SAM-dependent methyltransferase [Lactococcus formosensis]MDG6126063.1 class I SAM-dependent methyltransferase [Lactococcus formosensis]MDG6132837.1 class I SAM-dependent methyltransferase [Lactococcus formosensis]MDG6134832.1 class I SAM-dependent methyltransferase [Lactococcus formosensis]
MTEEEQDLVYFWDGFAEEYEEIQQESPFPIAQELGKFLVQEKILPCPTLLDIAGGSGRYLSVFQDHVKRYTLADISPKMLELAREKRKSEHVDFLRISQEALIQTNKKFQVVFSAMNPALNHPEKIKELCQLSQKWCLIFRLVKDEDSLFSPYDQEVSTELKWMEDYKNFLQKEKQEFFVQQFTFGKTEMISKNFFLAYFEDECSKRELEHRINEHFGVQDSCKNYQKVVYELIYIPCNKK